MRGRMMLGFAVVALAACQQGETPEQKEMHTQAVMDSAKTAIRAGNAAWMRYTNTNHPDSIPTLMTATAVLMPPDVKGATGNDSIVARYRPLVLPGGTLTTMSVNLSVADPIAVDRGTWTYTAPAGGGRPAMNLAGKYMSHWHHEGGKWLIAETIWNNDAPMPPMPGAPARH